MANRSSEVPLTCSVEDALRSICELYSLPPPDSKTRKALAALGEETALQMLKRPESISDFISTMARVSGSPGSVAQQGSRRMDRPKRDTTLPFSSGLDELRRPTTSDSSSFEKPSNPSNTLLDALGELEFRKSFMILSYCGKKNLKEVMDVNTIQRIKDLPMVTFESELWRILGRECISETDRSKYHDWDSGRTTYIYRCHVAQDGTCIFKGPSLQKKKTHLQRVLGDENVLDVRFAEEGTSRNTANLSIASFHNIAKEGICVGLRRYRFFVFKDGGKEERKKSPASSSVKSYFVRVKSDASIDCKKSYILSNKSIHEARCIFMHVHTVSSIAKYMLRFSLILSKTVKLDVDLALVNIQRIPDETCKDKNGNIIYDEEGKALIHTDGTSFISEDLAMKCPRNIFKGNPLLQEVQERNQYGIEDDKSSAMTESTSHIGEPPLLIQCRLFNNGCAVKGTFLINKELPPHTIQIRPSMIKVESDPNLLGTLTANSLEIVSTSNRPTRTTCLSKYLIALLNYGGVPNQYFMDLLSNALKDAQNVRCNKRTALKVSLRYGEMDDFLVSRVLLCGIPLDEPYLQYRLSVLIREERKALKGGKIPISDSYYLMGTADPTGLLKTDEVCIILADGQISGKVLVYRNPGLHFGDIHVLTATYCKEIGDIVGNANYGIFFPIKGPQSLADEIAKGDFDGDNYWVSRNPQLLDYFKTSDPWLRSSPQQSVCDIKPTDFKYEELEDVILQQFLKSIFNQSNKIGTAADSWFSLMDRLLTLGNECEMEKNCLKEKMLKLVDLYYDALNAPKTGMEVAVPDELKVEKFPHFMERPNSYCSKSILGFIYDEVNSFSTREQQTVEVWELPFFNKEVPESCMKFWEEHYEKYRQEMTAALKLSDESNDKSVIQKYKQILYGGAEFEESRRDEEEIFNDALAIYKIAYKYAKNKGVGKCSFPWKVAGRALCKLHAKEQDKDSIVCSKSVLRELFN